VLLVLIGCAPAPNADGRFPIIGSDPDGLVATMSWRDAADPEIPPETFDEPLVLDTSAPKVVEIAVKGGGCPPSAQVAVSGPAETIAISMNLGGAIEPPGIECTPTLTTHVMVIEFNDPIDVDGLDVTAVRSAPISGG
jgi:hypothetical protein